MAIENLNPLRIQALRGVWKPDHDSTLRRVFRWYSEKFHTPLHEVPDLPLEDILLNWFEVHYEQMEPEEKHNLGLELLETPEERRKRESDDKNSEESFIRLTQQMAERQRASKQLKTQVAEVKAALDKIVPQKAKPNKETSLPSPKPANEEEITISYTDKPFDDDEDPMLPPLRKPK